jgi:hypothetical protein
MSTYPYKYMYDYPTSMSTYERLSRFYFEIYEVGHQEHLAVDEDIVYH